VRSSFLLLANLARGGLFYEGKYRQGVYAGAFSGGKLTGIAAHYWNGNVILQAPEHAARLVLDVARLGSRRIDGLLGPWAQVVAARAALGRPKRPTRIDSEEILYEIEIDRMEIPAPLARRRFACRYAEESDISALLELSVRENEELFHEGDTPEVRSKLTDWLVRGCRERDVFLLEEGERPIAMSLFQGRVLGRVQIGGVYTLPEFRNRGCARSIVAGSLLLARGGGIHTATLFTGVDNTPAQHAYESLGFGRIGDYGIVLFASA